MQGLTAYLSPPQTWCRYVLHLLTKQEGPEEGTLHREMLLAYFIQRDPSAEEFGEQLERLAAEPCGEVAQAAALLLEAWRRARAEAAPTWPMDVAELLRTLGALLDEAGARVARVMVTTDGVQLQLIHDLGADENGPVENWDVPIIGLQLESSARMAAMRGRVPPPSAAPTARHEARLRVSPVGFAAE
jgi:hypothetical protein